MQRCASLGGPRVRAADVRRASASNPASAATPAIACGSRRRRGIDAASTRQQHASAGGPKLAPAAAPASRSSGAPPPMQRARCRRARWRAFLRRSPTARTAARPRSRAGAAAARCGTTDGRPTSTRKRRGGNAVTDVGARQRRGIDAAATRQRLGATRRRREGCRRTHSSADLLRIACRCDTHSRMSVAVSALRRRTRPAHTCSRRGGWKEPGRFQRA